MLLASSLITVQSSSSDALQDGLHVSEHEFRNVEEGAASGEELHSRLVLGCMQFHQDCFLRRDVIQQNDVAAVAGHRRGVRFLVS